MKNKMKIALLTQGFVPDAAEATNITIRLLAEELIKQGDEVFIFCNQIFKQPLVENYKGINIRRTNVKYCSFNYPKKTLNYPFLKYTLKYFNYSDIIEEEIKKSGREFDVIHNFSSSPLLAIRGILAKRHSKNAKLIQTIKAKSLYKSTYVFTFLLNFYDVVTVSAKFLQNMMKKSGLKSSKIKIVPSYIDTEKFKPRNKINLRSKYNCSGKKILVYYGHLSEKKGISYLINAVELLKNEDFLTLLVTCSPELYTKQYQKLIDEKKLQNKIKIIRNAKKVEEYVSLADAVVLPYPDLTSTEAQPSCVLETMASKTPLITTNIKELKELVSNKEVVLAKPSDAADLANKIKITLSKKTNKSMINRAYKKAMKFNCKTIIKEYLKIYNKV